MLGPDDYGWVPVRDDKGYDPAFILWNCTHMSAYVVQKPECVAAFVFGNEALYPSPIWQVFLSHKKTTLYREFEKILDAKLWSETAVRLETTGVINEL